MNEILETLELWCAQGEDVAMATVVNVDGSAPRAEGAKMLISASGKIAGSVSGGCVESAVAQEAQDVLASRRPKLVRYGINRNMMWDVGLSCGGAIDVFIERAELQPAVAGRHRSRERFAVCTIVGGSDRVGAKAVVDANGAIESGTGDAQLDRAVAIEAASIVCDGQSKRMTIGDVAVFVDVFKPAERLIIVGAVHIAAALCDFASRAGFAVTVIDPRPQLCNRERFPAAAELRVGWPEDELDRGTVDDATYVVVLTHDEKFDDPTLAFSLRTAAKYIGAIGSKKTQALRRQRLLDAGFTDADIERVHAPIGLDIGAQSPEEIAIAILAEMIATKYGHRGARLKELESAHIH